MNNRLQSAIQRGTQGRLSKLAVNRVDHHLIVKACSATYYGVQLALAAIQEFVLDFPEMLPARVEFLVGDRELILHHPFAEHAVRTDDGVRQEAPPLGAFVPDATVLIPNVQPRVAQQEETSKHLIAAGV